MLELNQIYCGDCIEIMKDIEDNSIDLTVTSPPYDSLRSYKGYTFDFENIAWELSRVTKKGGIIIWVVADETVNGSETGTSFRQALYFMDVCKMNLHDTMIYRKPNFSNPEKVRYHQVFEYMFVFSKGNPRTFNPIKDRKNVEAGKGTWGKNTTRQRDGEFTERKRKVNSEYGMRHNVWDIKTVGQQLKKLGFKSPPHPAMFPPELARDHIISWSNEGDIVLDPMCGSGIACKKAKDHNRNFIGIDISEEYCDEARKIIRERKQEIISTIFQ